MSEKETMNKAYNKIVCSPDKWSQSETHPEYYFRIANHLRQVMLFRKEVNEAYYGGYQIKYVPVESKLGHEWIDVNFK